MYQCRHCKDRHFAADQARRCAELGNDWVDDAVEEVLRQAERGRVPWEYKMAHRSQGPWTRSEHILWHSLRRALPDEEICAQWWIADQDYKVDFLISSIKLVVEVDGTSHIGREGPDRLRSMDIRDQGYQIARVTVEDVMRDADRIALQIASRLHVRVEIAPPADEVVAPDVEDRDAA